MQRVIAPDVARLRTFCHATVGGGLIFVSGTLGTDGARLALVDGGVRAETRQVLHNIGRILAACGASLDDLMKVNVYLADMADFAAMNEGYLELMGEDPPARVTVGRADLALNARVEMDAVALAPARR